MMKKNARVELRLPHGSKVRWQGTADGLGYPNLSSFIEDTIEQVHFASETGAVAEVIPIYVAREPIVEHTFPTASAIPKRRAEGDNVANHRKGTYCKSCGRGI